MKQKTKGVLRLFAYKVSCTCGFILAAFLGVWLFPETIEWLAEHTGKPYSDVFMITLIGLVIVSLIFGICWDAAKSEWQDLNHYTGK